MQNKKNKNKINKNISKQKKKFCLKKEKVKSIKNIILYKKIFKILKIMKRIMFIKDILNL